MTFPPAQRMGLHAHSFFINHITQDAWVNLPKLVLLASTLLLSAHLFVGLPVRRLVLQAAVSDGLTAGAHLEHAARGLSARAGRQRASPLLLHFRRFARVLVTIPIHCLVRCTAVHNEAADGAVRELFDGRLFFGARREGAPPQAVLGDVVALPGFEHIVAGVRS